MHTIPKLAVLILLAVIASAAHAQPKLYHNANIYTLDPDMPRAEVMLVEDGLISAIGSEASVRDAMRVKGIRVIERVDMHGFTILPGLIDAHGHMVGLGALGLGMLDLRAAKSYDEVIKIIRDRASHVPAGTWIVGRGWDNEAWQDTRLPHHAKLSKAVPDHPVWITRVDGHAGLANAHAMELAGVTPATPSPDGGEILRDQKGNAIGLFVDKAKSVIGWVLPAGLTGTTEEALLRAQEMCLSVGLTGVQDAGVSPAEIEVYKKLEAEGKLKIRIYAMIHADDAPAYFEANGTIDSFKLSVYAAKAYADGSMGSRGAWLLDPYTDRPTGAEGKPYTGLVLTKPKAIEELATHALEYNYQLCTHAIGDRANRETLDAYERAFATRAQLPADASSDPPDPRFRIEHAQLLNPDDIPRFAALGVIPAMQPTHCTSDMRWVDDRVGPERAKGAYAWASLLKSGARPAFGSDFPVESHNPFLGIFAAITRQNLTEQPTGGWHAEQRLTRQEALRAFTIDAAYAAFWETRTGTLQAGKLADFIVIDRDIMTCDPLDIADTKVLQTISYGEVVYEAK